jgi:DNA-binding NtrC family response regulator
MSIEPIHNTDVAVPQPAEAAPRKTGPALSEFEEFLSQAEMAGEEPSSLRAWLDLAEAWKITKTLRECRGNRSAAARTLGIGRRTLYAKMEKLQITPTWAMRGRNLED